MKCDRYASGGVWAFGPSAENLQIPQQLDEAMGLKTYKGGRDLQLGLQISGSFMPMIPWLRGCPILWQPETACERLCRCLSIFPRRHNPLWKFTPPVYRLHILCIFLPPSSNPWTPWVCGSQAEVLALKKVEAFASS